MTADQSHLRSRAQRVQEAFTEAIGLPQLALAPFLGALRDHDPTIADEVESLLGYHARMGGIAEGAGNPTISLPATMIGKLVGGCRIEKLIGYGGMSAVYAATQEFPRRRVAVKIVRRERLGAGARRRLRVEAEALARLEHPNIARVYAAGTQRLGDQRDNDDNDSPFIVMELIEHAVALNRWANDHGLDALARIDLVAQIADAIEHAHRAGVIHRDIKPGNVIVGADGTPKIIDFGIAAVRNSTVTAATEGPMGTLAYMSPEQARGGTIDTRSDVWGLGALLYDLLTGQPPFDAADRSVVEHINRLLHDTAPPIAPLAAASNGAAFAATLPVGCDAVLRKALSSDANRRYRSAAEFADELRRLIARETLIARPDSEWDAMVRLTRRHRPSLIAATGIFAAVSVGLVVSLMLLKRETAAHERAQWSAYVAAISAANSMQERGDASAAHDMLQAAPEEHRGWEWNALWRLSSQSMWHVSYPQGMQVYGVDFSRDGSTIFAAASGSISAIDVRSRTERWRAIDESIGVPFGQAAWRVRALPNGHVLANFLDGSIRRFDEGGKVAASLAAPAAYDLAIDATGTRLFVNCEGGALELDPMTLAAVRPVLADPPIPSIPRALAVDGRATLLVAGDWDGVVTAFDATSGAVRWTWRTEQRGEEIRATAVSPDGTRAAAVSSSGLIVLNCATGNVLWHHLDASRGYRSCVFSADASEIITSAWSESVDRFNADTGVLNATIVGAFSQVWQSAVSPDGKLIASGTFGARVEVFEADASSTLVGITLDGSPVTSVSASVSASVSGGSAASGPRVYATTANGGLFAIDGARATHVDAATRIDFAMHANGVCALPSGELAVSHDSGVAWIATDGRVLRSVTTAQPATRIGSLEHGALTDVRVGDDLLLAFDSASGAPRWQVGGFTPRSGYRSNTLGGDVACDSAQPGVVFLPRGSGCDQAWLDTATSREIGALSQSEYAMSAERSPDGTLIALGCVARSSEVTLVDAKTLEFVASLPNHRGGVRCVRWSPDGNRLASASIDGTVRVWHVARGVEILTAWRGACAHMAWDSEATLWLGCEDGKIRAIQVR